MATRDGGATPFLAFIVGGLIVVVAVIGYMIYSGAASTKSMNLAVNLPSAAHAPQPAPTPAPLPKPAG